jgi:hypothetical protein
MNLFLCDFYLGEVWLITSSWRLVQRIFHFINVQLYQTKQHACR